MPLLKTRVIIRGLVSRTDLNGRCGRTTSYDAERDRYAVEIENGGGTLSVRPANLERAGRRQADPGAFRMLLEENALLGFPKMQQMHADLIAAGQSAPTSFDGPLPDGSRHLAGAVVDPSGAVAGVLNTFVPNASGKPDPRTPPLLLTFMQGRHVPDDDNPGAQANWAAAAQRLDWRGHAAAIRAAAVDPIVDVSITVDRPDSPRLLTLQGGCLEVSILLSPCTTSVDPCMAGFDSLLWTSEAHCRSLNGTGAAPSGSASKKGTRKLTCAALVKAIEEERAAESWALALFVANTRSQKSVELSVAAYALLTDFALALNQGRHSSRWQCFAVKHGEALEALGQFSAAAQVYELAADAAVQDPALVGGRAFVPNSLGNLGLAHKRAGDTRQAEAAYQRALKAVDDPTFPPEAYRITRNRIAQRLAQLYRENDAAESTRWLHEIFRIPFTDMELRHRGASCILGWEEGGVPIMRVPSRGRTWRMLTNGHVTEDSPQRPEPAGRAVRRMADDAAEWPNGPSTDSSHSRQLLPNSDATSLTCAHCGQVGPSSRLKRCARCLGPAYCGTECQAKAWPSHKRECRAAAASAAARKSAS